MSRLIERRFFAWTGLVIAVGLMMRFLYLESRPAGVDSDQALVIVYGLDLLREGRWALVQSEMTRFESVASYFFALAWRFLGSGRIVAVALAFIELGILFTLVRRRSGTSTALLATALLASSPWHWFYSRITGPCVGAAAFLLWYWLWRDRPARALPMIAGWFWYGVFRFVWLWEIFWGRLRRWTVLAMSAVAVVFIYVLSGSSFADLFRRGHYNWPLSLDAWMDRLSATAQLWVLPPGEVLRHGTARLVVDPVSQGIATLSGGPLLTWSGVLVLLALLVTVIRRQEFRKTFHEELLLLGVGAGFLILSPTPSHGLILVPMLYWMMAECLWRMPGKARWVFAILLPINGIAQSVTMLNDLGHRGVVESVFEDRWETELSELIDDEAKVVLVADQSIFSARLRAEKMSNALALLTMPVTDFETLLRRQGHPGVEQVVVFDRFRPELPEHLRPDFDLGQDRLTEMENHLRARARVSDFQVLRRDGRVLFHAYRVTW